MLRFPPSINCNENYVSIQPSSIQGFVEVFQLVYITIKMFQIRMPASISPSKARKSVIILPENISGGGVRARSKSPDRVHKAAIGMSASSQTKCGLFKQLVPTYNPKKPADALLVVMVRHGQTIGNAERVLEGHLDSDLTGRGHQEGLLLGKALSKESFAAVYQSDMKRCRMTTDTIRRCQDGSHEFHVEDSEFLRDRNCGDDFVGKSVDSIDEAARQGGQGPRDFIPKNGESWEQVRKRAELFMQQLLVKHLPPPSSASVAQNKLHGNGAPKHRPNIKSVLVVTHGGLIKEWVSVMAHYGGGKLQSLPVGPTAPEAGRPRWPMHGQLAGNSGGATNYPNKARNTGVYRFFMQWHNGRLTVTLVEENNITHLRGLPTTC